MPFYYVMYTMNPHLHSAHHNMKQGLYPVWMEEYTEPFAIASAHLFGSLGGSDCRNFETLLPPCPVLGYRRLIGRCASREGREGWLSSFLVFKWNRLKGLLLQNSKKQHWGLEFAARVGAGLRARNQSPMAR